MRCLSIILSLSLVITISSQGCPEGWRISEVIPNKCYYVTDQKKIWFEAEVFCRNAQPNAHLTSITSAFENANVDAVATSTLNGSACEQYWIGGNDIAQTGKFTWMDGSPLQYTNWAPGQPDSTQHCVSSAALKAGQWKTENCGIDNCIICEMYKGGSTYPPPSSTPSTTTSTRTSNVNSPTTTPSTTTSTLTSVVNSPTTTPAVPPTTMTDCRDWSIKGGAHTDGIYPINPDGNRPINVFCDMTTDGGGWTVFQRRVDGSVLFYDKLWYDYKHGFNNGLENNLWLGNELLHVLTNKDSNVQLRVDLWGDRSPYYGAVPNGTWWETRTNFVIDNETSLYTFHVSYTYAGNATLSADSGIFKSNNLRFATLDSMNGTDSSCFTPRQNGGWWFPSGCGDQALNGIYNPSTYFYRKYGIFWYTGGGAAITIVPNQTRMMLRRILS